MDVKVNTKYLKISPRKLRPVVNLVRGKKTDKARDILTFTPNKGAKMVVTLLNSAVAVVKNAQIDDKNFYIKSIACSDGPRLKRGTPVSKGRMAPITKRQSHLSLVISDDQQQVESKKLKVKPEVKPEITSDKKVEEVKEKVKSKSPAKAKKAAVAEGGEK